jgi:hypothetical protein
MVFDDEGVALPPLAALARQSKEVLNAPPGTIHQNMFASEHNPVRNHSPCCSNFILILIPACHFINSQLILGL